MIHKHTALQEDGCDGERLSGTVKLREKLLSVQTGFNLVSAAVVCAILESIVSQAWNPHQFSLRTL